MKCLWRSDCLRPTMSLNNKTPERSCIRIRYSVHKCHVEQVGCDIPSVHFSIQHHKQNILVVLYSSCNQTPARLGCITGLDPDSIGIFVKKLVVCSQTIHFMSRLFHKNGFLKTGHLVKHWIPYCIFRKSQKILCCRYIACINTFIKTGRVGKAGIFHSNHLCLIVHGGNKRINIT